MRKLIFTLLVPSICLVFPQEYEPEDSLPIHLDTIIDNGWLIFYGKLVERPYHFSLKNDTFWINEMQYLPSPPDPLEKPPEWVPELTELGKWYFQASEIFFDSCRTKYNRWRRMSSATDAMDKLVHWIDTQDFISIKSAEPYGSSIKITFGYRHLDLYSNPTPRLTEVMSEPEVEYVTIHMMGLGTVVDTTLTPPTQNEIFLSSCQWTMRSLKGGSTLFITRGGYQEIGVKGRETEFIDSIKEILSESIPKEQMIHELRTKTDLDSLRAEYIILNRDSWIERE